jgi:hypothetical protein
MKTRLQQFDDHVRVVVSNVDPALAPQMAGFEFVPIEDRFERRFELGPPDLVVILQRFQESIEDMVRQLAGWDQTPWESALLKFITLAETEIDWWLVGSTALAVRGIRVEPKDVDVVVAEEDFFRTNELFDRFIVEPPQETEEFIARFFTRAFMDARVEWVAGVYDWVDSGQPSDFGPVAQRESESIQWKGAMVHVPPLQMQLSATLRRGLEDRAALIQQFLKANVQQTP